MKKSPKKKKAPKKFTIPIFVPGDVLDFYAKVGGLAGCSKQTAMMVVVAIEMVKTLKGKVT